MALSVGELLRKARKDPSNLTVDEAKQLQSLRAMHSGASAGDRLQLSGKELAEAMGTCVRTLKRHAAHNDFPHDRRGSWNALEVITFLYRRLEERSRRQLLNSRERISMADAELREMELRRKRDELVERWEAEKELSRMGEEIKTSLLSLPRSVAPRLDGLTTAQREALISKELQGCLEHLSSAR